jgi:hypothetical protein
MTVPERVLFAQTNVTVHLRLSDLRAVDLVIHRMIFTEDHNGCMNVYAVENQLDCSIGMVMVEDVC